MLAGFRISQIGAKWAVLHSYVAGCLSAGSMGFNATLHYPVA